MFSKRTAVHNGLCLSLKTSSCNLKGTWSFLPPFSLRLFVAFLVPHFIRRWYLRPKVEWQSDGWLYSVRELRLSLYCLG